ncbi:MAG: response regulator transcription factor [Chloroflexi bacterium]|nr:response regulator transcription factor [Chloroflexota bacterium]
MKASILVVDDEPVERQTLTDILKLDGYHVIALGSGEAAVDYVRLNPVDLMVLDLRMPGMSGLDVSKVVGQVSPDTEIVLLTAHGSMETAIEALRQRVHDYLLKPATPSQIIASVERGLAHRKARLESMMQGQPPEDEDGPVAIQVGDTTVDFSRRMIFTGNLQISLTPAEGRLLRILVENPGKVFTHRDLVLMVQGYVTSQHEAPEILRPLVSRLRQKLEDAPTLGERLVSVRGTGYIFEKEAGNN